MKKTTELFRPQLVSDLFNKVKGKSALAVLSASEPIPFTGTELFTFSLDKEIDVVAEGGKKTHGGLTLEPMSIRPIKVEYGARVTDEFMFAADESKIKILEAFNDGFSKKLAKGLDIMAFHGLNPRTGAASDVIGTNHFDAKVTTTVKLDKSDPEAAIEAAIMAIRAADGDISGMAMAPALAAELAKLKVNGVKQFPELAWGADPGVINGLPVVVNNTVYTSASKGLAIVGDFESAFKWGFAKDVFFELIQYGDPDNSGVDLKGYNQVYLRAEAYLGWGILSAESFARILEAV